MTLIGNCGCKEGESHTSLGRETSTPSEPTRLLQNIGIRTREQSSEWRRRLFVPRKERARARLSTKRREAHLGRKIPASKDAEKASCAAARSESGESPAERAEKTGQRRGKNKCRQVFSRIFSFTNPNALSRLTPGTKRSQSGWQHNKMHFHTGAVH